MFDAGIPRESETHAGEDVGIYAQGPMAHLFHGTHEQSYIAHVAMYALCVGPYSNYEMCGEEQPEADLAGALRPGFYIYLLIMGKVLIALMK